MRRALRLHSSDLSRRIGAALAKEAEGLELRVYGFRVYDLGVVNLGPTVGYVLSRRMEGSERGREREREKERQRQTDRDREAEDFVQPQVSGPLKIQIRGPGPQFKTCYSSFWFFL